MMSRLNKQSPTHFQCNLSSNFQELPHLRRGSLCIEDTATATYALLRSVAWLRTVLAFTRQLTLEADLIRHLRHYQGISCGAIPSQSSDQEHALQQRTTMSLVLSAPKIVLLGVHLAAKADLDSLSFIAANNGSVLRKELLLRILLTYLPETLKSQEYVSFLEEVHKGEYATHEHWEVDTSAVEQLSEEQAVKKVRKLYLLKLSWPEAPEEAEGDLLTLFLLRRAYKVDEEAGLLTQLPDLLTPFLDHSPYLRTWTISVLLPLLRRNYEYYPQDSVPITLAEFEQLGDAAAIDLLLSQTGAQESDYTNVSRDLRGLVGPWLYSDKRWIKRKVTGDREHGADEEEETCPGWEQMLVWLTSQASTNWKVAVEAIDHWHGPEDVDLGGFGQMWMSEDKQQYLEHRYARAGLACAYLVPEATTEALTGAYTLALEVTKLLDDPLLPLQTAASNLSPVPDLGSTNIMLAKNVTYLRNNLLDESNPLTKPTELAVALLSALVVSAFLSTRSGSFITVRKAGELAMLQDEREQKAEFFKLIHTVSERGPSSDDKFWIRARNEILWLKDWGAEEEESPNEDQYYAGIYGRVKKDLIEVEILKALLAHTRTSDVSIRHNTELTENRSLSCEISLRRCFGPAFTEGSPPRHHLRCCNGRL